MGRMLLLIWSMLIGSLAFSAPALYLTNAEKALVGIVLKAAQELSEKKNSDVLPQVANRFALLANQFRDMQKLEPTVVKVSSFEEFIYAQSQSELFKDYRLDETSDEDLIRMLRSVKYVSDSTRVQKKIVAYEIERFKKISEFVTGLGMQALTFDSIQAGDLSLIQAEIQSAFSRRVDELTQNLNQNESVHVKVLEKLLKAYFKNLPDYQKIEILYRISHMPFDTKPMDILLTMIQNSGPQIQKLIQIMGRSEKVPVEFQEIFQKLESGVRPVPWWKVEKLLREQRFSLQNYTYFERKPVGVGTMAQTHRAQYIDREGNRKSIVVRFLKPEIEKYLDMDHEILKVIANEIDTDAELKEFNLPSLADLVEDLHSSVVEELNVSTTVMQQKNGSAGLFSFNRNCFVQWSKELCSFSCS